MDIKLEFTTAPITEVGYSDEELLFITKNMYSTIDDFMSYDDPEVAYMTIMSRIEKIKTKSQFVIYGHDKGKAIKRSGEDVTDLYKIEFDHR